MWIKNKIIIHVRTYIYIRRKFFFKIWKKVCGLKKSLYICNVIKKQKKMDIRETKQRVLTNKHYYVLEHHYSCNCCKINGIEFITQTLYIYVNTEVKNINNVIDIKMNLNVEDCNNVTIAKFRNIDGYKINTNTYDFDEELCGNLLLIVGEVKKNENYYNKKQKQKK